MCTTFMCQVRGRDTHQRPSHNIYDSGTRPTQSEVQEDGATRNLHSIYNGGADQTAHEERTGKATDAHDFQWEHAKASPTGGL